MFQNNMYRMSVTAFMEKNKLSPVPVDPYYNVTMSNELVYGTSDLSVNAQRLFYYAVATIRENDTDFTEIPISVKGFQRLFKIKSKKIYEDINKACDELLDAKIYFIHKDKDKEKEKWIKINIMSYIQYENGIVLVKFNNDLKEHLLNLSQKFSSNRIGFLATMKTGYSMRILNFFFHKIGEEKGRIKKGHTENIVLGNDGKPKAIRMRILKRELQNLAVGNNIYNKRTTGKFGKLKFPTFSLFNRDVFQPCVDKINETGIFKIELEETLKKGNEIMGFIFQVSKGDNYKKMDDEFKNLHKEYSAENEEKMVNAYFFYRFSINKTQIEKLKKAGFTNKELKFAAIAMQARLNATYLGIWHKDLYKTERGKKDNYAIANPFEYLKNTMEKKEYLKALSRYGTVIENRGNHDEFTANLDSYSIPSSYANMSVDELLKDKSFENELNKMFKSALDSTSGCPNPKSLKDDRLFEFV